MRNQRIWKIGFVVIAILFCLGGVNRGKVLLATGAMPSPIPTPTPTPTPMQEEDESKGVTSEFFLNDRPPKRTPKPNTARYKAPPKSPRNISAITVPPPGKVFADIGLTIWRCRFSSAADKTKELVEENGESNEWTLERIEEGTPLLVGQKVRLSIESLSRAGYLYVIDREQYADDTLGNPKLIFPTQKTGDANRVKAGCLIYIPSATARFRIDPSQGPKQHVGELVTLIVSSQPLIEADKLRPKAIWLPRQQVETWEKQWSVTPTKLEMEGGVGQAMTEKEQAAGCGKSEELTQDDPPPQTVYRLAVKPENPILLNVQLKFHR